MLYFKGLDEHIRLQRALNPDAITIKRYIGLIPIQSPREDQTVQKSEVLKPRKTYNKIILNRWRVFVFIIHNPSLIFYRKNNEFSKMKVVTARPTSILERLPCCKKRIDVKIHV